MCFSLGWLEQLLVWLVIVCAIIAVLKLELGVPVIAQVLNIILWAVIVIFGAGMPLFPRH